MYQSCFSHLGLDNKIKQMMGLKKHMGSNKIGYWEVYK